jgi:Na+-translocating ferredoxin:NAD+ oxidoreductase RNF subunit RnfB
VSEVARIRALLPGATPRPWGYTGVKPAAAATVADFTDIADCELAAVAVNRVEALLALYDAVKAMEARLKVGKLPLSAQRKAALKALTAVDA